LASGYNRVTTLSPIHGAMIAASIAADGVMKAPYLIKSIRSNEGELLYQAQPFAVHKPFSVETSDDLKDMMEATIMSGTSRKSFRELKKDKIFDELFVGGKTGSLTGTSPRGKNDWFVGFAIRGKQRIAISAITVNKEHWTVKSSFLAQTMIKKFFKMEVAEESLQARQDSKANRTATN
jgi:peptidoglycan glycosyltransferase